MQFRNSSQSIFGVCAEILAAPFCAKSSFEFCLTGLDPANSGRNFRSLVEAEILSVASEFSANEITSLIHRVWFNGSCDWIDQQSVLVPDAKVDFFDYLNSVATQIFEQAGPTAKPDSCLFQSKVNSNRTAERHSARIQYRWISRSLPIDLLVHSLGDCSQVNSISHSLNSLLVEQKFAETHLHLGAAYSFSQLWTAALNAVANSHLGPTDFASPNAPFEHGKFLGVWLLMASTVRIVLARFLFLEKPGATFADYCAQRWSIRFAGMDAIDQVSAVDDGNDSILRQCFLSLQDPLGHCPPLYKSFFLSLQSVNKRLRKRLGQVATDITELLLTDPIAPLVPREPEIQSDCEDQLIRAAKVYLSSDSGSQDLFFNRMFWQLQRVRCQLFRHVTQQQSVRGLVWFTRYYRRISAARRGVTTPGARVELASHFSGYNKGLRSLEIRTSPPDQWAEFLDEVTDVAQMGVRLENQRATPGYKPVSKKAVRASEKLELELGVLETRYLGESTDIPKQIPIKFESGLVLHLIKERQSKAQDYLSVNQKQSHSNPSRNRHNYRYGNYFSRTMRAVKAVARVIRDYPLTLQWIRGVDVCNDELSMPTWLFAHLFNVIHEASRTASLQMSQRLQLNVPMLRTTAHVGEDFVHLLTGLRRIDEAISFLNIGEGDRLGHALALGENPLSWSTSVGVVPVPRITRLFDLVWVWEIGNEISSKLPPNYLQRVESEVRVIVSKLFDFWTEGSLADDVLPTVKEISNLRYDLVDRAMLERIGYPDYLFDADLQQRNLRILIAYLRNQRFFEAAIELELIDPASNAAALMIIQNYMRTRISTTGIVVEVNPTSNVVVGKYPDITSHPMWRLSNPNYDDEVPEVSLCIGSDDPLVFATDLRQEYQYLYDGLITMGYSESKTRRWLESVCRNGIDNRFTLPQICNWPINKFRGQYW